MKILRLLTIISIILFLSTSFCQAQHLWATTTQGGDSNSGTLLEADSNGTNFHVVCSFVNSKGAYPQGDLVMAEGQIYGVTQFGGYGDSCVIFSYDTVANTYSDIYNFFEDTAKGFSSYSGMMKAKDGNLYGLCYAGGAYGNGAIFNLNPTTNIYTLNFSIDSGSNPSGGLIQLRNGKFYGMTQTSGYEGSRGGLIFSYDPTNNKYKVLHDFGSATGWLPLYGNLLLATDGKFYGMTQYGGEWGYGVIFSLDTTTNAYTDLYDFYGVDGGYPDASLIQAQNGKLYGMTQNGGKYRYGNIFSYDIDSNKYTGLFYFNDTNGAIPERSLMQASNGLLYGTTNYGGSHGAGVIFSYNITNNTYNILLDCDTALGLNPSCDILETRKAGSTEGIATIKKTNAFSVYPVPATNAITIEDNTVEQLEFFDLLGRSIYIMKTSSTGKNNVDIFSFPKIFFVKTQNGITKKVIKE
jgi:uncharacterized repeat protein (TIGR03803 family)